MENKSCDLGESNIQDSVSGMYILPWSLKISNAYCPFSISWGSGGFVWCVWLTAD